MTSILRVEQAAPWPEHGKDKAGLFNHNIMVCSLNIFNHQPLDYFRFEITEDWTRKRFIKKVQQTIISSYQELLPTRCDEDNGFVKLRLAIQYISFLNTLSEDEREMVSWAK